MDIIDTYKDLQWKGWNGLLEGEGGEVQMGHGNCARLYIGAVLYVRGGARR